MTVITTKSARETQKIARILAKELRPSTRAQVIALQGELGAGKTTFSQGFAHTLGVTERVLSPTFVLMKIYPLKKKHFSRLVHIDCYRITSPKDLAPLGIKEILTDPTAIVLIEWPERVKRIIPRDVVWIQFIHGEKLRERVITMRPNVRK
ncbi:MAG: tRNA (adenosine(37)-N6)-threonylcarbamoyltransferase complex ATPase subunit type 1 TsaE [Patescibacteria group bacterium]